MRTSNRFAVRRNRIEDRNHFEALVPRIYELGGELPGDMEAFYDMSACPPSGLPKDPTDVQAILNEEIEHESWFSEPLGEGPSGHFLRRGETSPFVSKFMM